MDDINIIDFHTLEDGAYQLMKQASLGEAVKWELVEFDRLYKNKIRLPDGKDNIIYIITDAFQSALNMINNKNFIMPSSYRKVFYPSVTRGSFLGKRYSINVSREVKLRMQQIKDIKKLPINSRVLPKKNRDNLFFITSDILSSLNSIIVNIPIKRLMSNYFSQLNDILNDLSPLPEKDNKGIGGSRIWLFDSDNYSFQPNARLIDNRNNPLFLLYLAFLREKNLSNLNVDIDMLIISKNQFMKFNPIRLEKKQFSKFRSALFRIMKINLDSYVDQLSDIDKSELNQTSTNIITQNIVDKSIDVYTKYNSPALNLITKSAVDRVISQRAKDEVIKNTIIDKTMKDMKVTKPMDHSKSDVKKSMFNQIFDDYDTDDIDYKSPILVDDDILEDDIDTDDVSIDIGKIEDNIEDEVREILLDDDLKEELLDEIQPTIVPLDSKLNSPVINARDEKLREAQKKVLIKNSSIGELLSREGSSVPLKEDDVSEVMHTLNTNVKHIKFANFDKTYIDELYTRDIVAVLDSLKDKSTPFYIQSIEIIDASTSLDLKETWKVKFKDETGKNHTFQVNIPKFHQDKFMWLGGNKKMILKQNFYNPLVKDTPDTVMLTTAHKKMSINRRETKSFSQIEKLFVLMRKTNDDSMFISGNAFISNRGYISTLEFDEISKSLFKFESNGCKIYFDRKYISDNISEFNIKDDIQGNEFLIGIQNNIPILINEDTGKDRNGNTIIEIIYNNLSDTNKAIFDSIPQRKQTMYADGKLLGKFMPVITTLIVWEGISKVLDKTNERWVFHEGMKKLPKETFNVSYIKFMDGILEYDSSMFMQLLLNGLQKMNPQLMTFNSLNSEEGYLEYVKSVFGNYGIITQLKTFYEFLIDPITASVCRDLNLPDDAVGLILHAVKLLADNQSVSKASDKSYRLRSNEIIPSILYKLISDQYQIYVKSGRRVPFTIPKDKLIAELLAVPTVENYSTLNPPTEVGKFHTVLAKGFAGSNMDRSYDEAKRSYDPSSIGKLSLSTSPDSNVGISKDLSIEPTILNARGYREPVDDIDQLKDVNVFSPVEELTPGTIRVDDPIRVSII